MTEARTRRGATAVVIAPVAVLPAAGRAVGGPPDAGSAGARGGAAPSLAGAGPTPDAVPPLAASADDFPWAGRDLDLDGIPLHFVDEGAGEVVLLLHGNPTWSYSYRALIAALVPRFRVVAPDHVGCGRSGRPGPRAYEYRARRRVEDLRRLLAHLGIERCHLVVHDWGALIGLGWAAADPSRVRSLTVLNSAAFPMPEGKRPPALLRWFRAPVLGEILVRATPVFLRVAARTCVARGPLPRSVARAYAAPYATWSDRRALLAFLRDIPTSPSHPTHGLAEAAARAMDALRDVPALLCWGMRDAVLDRDYLAEWLRLLPRAEVEEYADAGHYLLEDAGPEVVPRILRFLDAATSPVPRRG